MSRLSIASLSVSPPPSVPEGARLTLFRVPPEQAGGRLDQFLQGQFCRSSRTQTQRIVRASAYSPQGRPLRPGSRILAEQIIALWRAPWEEQNQDIDLPVLHEDEHLLAIHKPAGIAVHPTARYYQNTVIKRLQDMRPGAFLSLGHRIDRETSGVLLLSKTALCDRKLKRALELRVGIEKTYLALTWGVPHTEDGARSFRHEHALELDPTSPVGVKMRQTTGPGGLSAATRFCVEETATRPDGRSYARVRCMLETGRQHQIRVHLSSLGAPLVGDKLYGPDAGCFARSSEGKLTEEDAVRLELPRHALHATRLTLPHPITGEEVTIEAPLPADLATFWEELRQPNEG